MSKMKMVLAGAVLTAVSLVGVAGPAAASTESTAGGAVLECEMIFSDQVCATVEGTVDDVVVIVERFDEPSEIAALIEQEYQRLKCRLDPGSCGY